MTGANLVIEGALKDILPNPALQVPLLIVIIAAIVVYVLYRRKQV